MDPFASKDTLLRKADTLLGEARRVRKSASAAAEGDRAQMIEHAEDLERQAARLEKDAVSAKNGVFQPHAKQAGAPKPKVTSMATAGVRTPDPLAADRFDGGSPLHARRGRPPSS